MLVLISPRQPDQAQALRDWADFVHIRHIAEAGVPGYSMITPYENVTGGDPRFMHFYEMDTEDPERAFRTMTPLVSERIGAARNEGVGRVGEHARAPDHVREHVPAPRRTVGVTEPADFFSVVRTQRAHRAFSAEAVPDELVERVLEAAHVRAQRREHPALGVHRRARLDGA